GGAASWALLDLERRARVLVAEDNPVNQTIFLKQLEKLGLRADAVANGHEVLAALKDFPYELILMDCQMPGMDGYEATTRIREAADAPYRTIPIVAVTANAIKGDREKCLALGMNDYIAKPVHPDELGRVLAKWLKKDEAVISFQTIEQLRLLDDGL